MSFAIPSCLSAWLGRVIRKVIIGQQNVSNKILQKSTTCFRKIFLLLSLFLNVAGPDFIKGVICLTENMQMIYCSLSQINPTRCTILFNLLAPELFFLILAHSVYKMWISQEPNKLELWNKLHFKEKKTESIHHV